MKIKLGNTNDQTPRVEVVPLIDIIFCILTFFLLSGLQMSRQQALRVDTPQAKTAAAQTRDSLIVSLDEFDRLFIEKQLVPQLDILLEQVKSSRITNPNRSVTFYADRQVRYERVIEILDRLREVVGAENVVLGVKRPETATPKSSPSPKASPVFITPSPLPSSLPPVLPSPVRK
jgi:biopolymer transport protein ExbD